MGGDGDNGRSDGVRSIGAVSCAVPSSASYMNVIGDVGRVVSVWRVISICLEARNQYWAWGRVGSDRFLRVLPEENHPEGNFDLPGCLEE